MTEVFKYQSEKEVDTLFLGEKIGDLAENGQIILLSGELGSGKTIMVKGIAEGLNIYKKNVTSPTYNLINEYKGRLTLYHMDLYRLDRREELYDIGFEEYFSRGGIVVIEWPEIAKELIPPDYLYIKFKITDDSKRVLEIKARGNKGKRLKKGLSANVNFRN